MGKKTAMQNFEVILEPEEEGGFHMYVPALKGCHSYGRIRQEAIMSIYEAIALWVESAQKLGITIPEKPLHPEGQVYELLTFVPLVNHKLIDKYH